MNQARAAPDPAPVLGPSARHAARLPTKGRKRRRLLVLIGAYHDAGVDPSVRMLAARTGLTTSAVIRLVDALERDGLLEVERRPSPERYRYRLRAPREERRRERTAETAGGSVVAPRDRNPSGSASGSLASSTRRPAEPAATRRPSPTGSSPAPSTPPIARPPPSCPPCAARSPGSSPAARQSARRSTACWSRVPGPAAGCARRSSRRWPPAR